MKPLEVGTRFAVTSVDVTWMNGIENKFCDFSSLAHQLFRTYYHPLEDELPPDPWIRVGYRQMVWHILLANNDQFDLTYGLDLNYWWTGIGGPEIIGDVGYQWSWQDQKYRTMTLRGASGGRLGRHLSLLRCQPVALWTYLRGISAGVRSSEDYVAMNLRSSEEFLAEGIFSITRSTSSGDFQRMLWEMEGPYGRADQPGNSEYYLATHGGLFDL